MTQRMIDVYPGLSIHVRVMEEGGLAFMVLLQRVPPRRNGRPYRSRDGHFVHERLVGQLATIQPIDDLVDPPAQGFAVEEHDAELRSAYAFVRVPHREQIRPLER